jgi:hypothetical protein
MVSVVRIQAKDLLQTRIAARHQAVTHKPPMSSDSKAIPIASKRMGAEGAGIVPNA